MIPADWRVHLWLRKSVIKLVLVPSHEVKHFLLWVLHWKHWRAVRHNQGATLNAVSMDAVATAIFEREDLRIRNGSLCRDLRFDLDSLLTFILLKYALVWCLDAEIACTHIRFNSSHLGRLLLNRQLGLVIGRVIQPLLLCLADCPTTGSLCHFLLRIPLHNLSGHVNLGTIEAGAGEIKQRASI